MMDDIREKYFSYATGVVEGTIPACVYVRTACQRNLDRFNRDDMYFDSEAVDRVVNFIQHLKLFTGEFAGQHLMLQPWQFNIIVNTFGWKWKKNGLRVTRQLYLELGRKNAKTTTCAAILLYMMIADGENNASVILSANSAKQASLCFDICSNLLKSIDPKDKHFKRYRDTIKFDKTVSKIKVVAADSSKLDGENAHAFLTDELHEAPDGSVYQVLETSMGSRRQPLAMAATTAGFNLASFCYEQREYNIQVLNGLATDDTLQAFIYTLDEEDDWKDEKNWEKANPNLDISIKRDYIRSQIEKAQANPSSEINVRTKLMNEWCATATGSFIPMNYIFNSLKPINFDEWKDNEDTWMYVGLDFATMIDLTALSVLWEHDGKIYIHNRYYLPSSALKESVNKEKYRQWANAGYITITPGNSTDFDYVKNDLLKLCTNHNVGQINYDPWQSTYFIQKLMEESLPLSPYSQSMASMTAPTKQLQKLFLDGKIVMDKNPVTSWMYELAIPWYDSNDNIKLKKINQEKDKIDGVIADVMALAAYLQSMGWSNEIGTTNL